jgi:hypothetical protein
MKCFRLTTSLRLALGLVGTAALGLFLLLPGPRVARAADLTVCSAGPPLCDYSTIQAAVDAAREGDVIKVAAGNYTNVNNRGGLAQVVYIDKSVTLRGGYTTAFTDPPDPGANLTTLNARGSGRVLFVTGDVSPVVEGLRITGGDATGLGGAPLGVDAGGGVCVLSAALTFRDNQVFSNSAERGGGLYLGSSHSILSGNTIFSNFTASVWSGSGGGAYLYDSPATLRDNDISSNSATWRGGGLALSSSDATLFGNTVTANTATDGGGMSIDSGSPTLDGNTISANTAEVGGGLYLLSSQAALGGNNIIYNFANDRGGGLASDSSAVALVNTVVADNRTGTTGSGLYVDSSILHLSHTTVAHNSGGDGSGVYVRFNSTTALTNTILVSHTIGVYVAGGSSANLEGTLWGSGAWANGADWGGAGTIITGTINLWGDPDFIDSANGDYHIGSASAAIDVGVDAGVRMDIDIEPRPYHTPDLGADEYYPPGALKRQYMPLVLRESP